MADIVGTNGVDDLDGTTGDDTINPLQSNPAFGVGDLVDGGQGYDTLIVDASAATVGITSGTFLDGGGFTVFFLRSNATSPGPYFFVEEARGMQNVNLTGGSGGDILVGLSNTGVGDFLDGRGGNDSITGAAGADTIYGGNDNDTIYGGSGNDELWGGNHIDTLFGEDGNDYFYVSFGADTLDGGAGIDTADFTLFDPTTTGGVTVSLAQETATFENLSGTWILRSIAIVATGDSNDVLVGDGLNNALAANGGSDWLLGGGGADILYGGEGTDFVFGDADDDDIYGGGGNDVITGGAGRDLLYGGNHPDNPGPDGNDRFDFNKASESRPREANRDIILGFNDGDKIDLRSIDANRDLPGNQVFKWRPVFKKGVEGQLKYSPLTGLVQGDINGDRKPDFEIQVYGDNQFTNLDKADFFL